MTVSYLIPFPIKDLIKESEDKKWLFLPCIMADAGECMGTEWDPAGEGTKNPGEETPCWAAEEGELDPRKPEPGEGWGNMAGEGFMPGRGGGEAREKPVAAGLATKPPPCPLVCSGKELIHKIWDAYKDTSFAHNLLWGLYWGLFLI